MGFVLWNKCDLTGSAETNSVSGGQFLFYLSLFAAKISRNIKYSANCFVMNGSKSKEWTSLHESCCVIVNHVLHMLSFFNH